MTYVDDLSAGLINVKNPFFGAVGDGLTDDAPAIQKALNAVPSAGAIYVPQGIYRINSALTVPHPNVSILGSGAFSILKKGFNGTMFTAREDYTRFSDIALDGNQASGFTGSVVAFAPNPGGNYAIIERCYISNANVDGIHLGGVHDVMVRNCRFQGNVQSAVHVDTNTGTDTRSNSVIGCHIEGTHSLSAIKYISQNAGSKIDGAVIAGNVIRTGTGSSTGFGIEIFSQSGGDDPSNITVQGNTVELSASANGGYSFSPIRNSAIRGNTFKANGFAAATAGIELVLSLNNAVSGNALDIGDGLTDRGLILDRGSSYNAVVGNTVNGASVTGSIRLYSSISGQNVLDNLIANNTILWGGATTGLSGIHVQSNNAGSSVSRNLIFGNVIRGNNATGSVGVKLLNSAGTLDKSFVTGNIWTNVLTGLSQTGDTNTLVPAGTNQS